MRRWIWIALLGIVGLGLLAWSLLIGPSLPEDSLLWWVGLLYLMVITSPVIAVIAIGVTVAVRAGHLAAVAVVGYRPRALRIGPFHWVWDGDRRSFRFTRAVAHWFRGSVSATSSGAGHANARWACIVLGGMLASLALAIPGILVRFAVPLDTPPARFFLILMSDLSAWIVIAGFLPWRTGAGRADGLALWILVRGGPPADRYAAMLSMSGTHPREWPTAWMTAATGLPDGSADDAYGCALAYAGYRERGDLDAAQRCLERALHAERRVSRAFRSLIYLDAAFFAAHYRNDAPLARDRLEKGKAGARVAPAAIAIAEAAVLLAEGDREGCHQRAQEALSMLGDGEAGAALRPIVEELLQRAGDEPRPEAVGAGG